MVIKEPGSEIMAKKPGLENVDKRQGRRFGGGSPPPTCKTPFSYSVSSRWLGRLTDRLTKTDRRAEMQVVRQTDK